MNLGSFDLFLGAVSHYSDVQSVSVAETLLYGSQLRTASTFDIPARLMSSSVRTVSHDWSWNATWRVIVVNEMCMCNVSDDWSRGVGPDYVWFVVRSAV
jgi:hypothetical protein